MKVLLRHSMWVAIALAVFAVAVCVPLSLYRAIQEASAYTTQVVGELGEKALRGKDIERTRQALTDTADERAQLDALALPVDGAAGLINMVESEARSANVALEVGDVTILKKDGTFGALALSLKAVGTFSSVMHFLKLVETLPYASTVSSIVFRMGEEKGAPWTFTAKLTVPIHKQ